MELQIRKVSNFSKKLQSLCSSEPMAGKPVTALPGIGIESGRKLQSQGYYFAIDVLDKYLDMNQNRDEFQAWLKQIGVNAKSREDCYIGVRGWTDNDQWRVVRN